MENKIIEAKFKTNTNAFIIGIIGVLSIIFGIIIIHSDYLRAVNYSYNSPYNFSEFFNDAMWLFGNYWGSNGAYVVYIGIILIIVFIWLFFMMKSCALTVYSTRVTGKASFGKQVDLPMNQISAIGLSVFKSITVATSAGRVHFWLIENREEVHKVLNELLSNMQANLTENVIPENSADVLKKYKDLLDSGVITQEEFDTKKKQLLGL